MTFTAYIPKGFLTRLKEENGLGYFKTKEACDSHIEFVKEYVLQDLGPSLKVCIDVIEEYPQGEVKHKKE